MTYDSNITRANIDLLTDKAPQSSIFELIEAAFSGNSKLALRLYSEQRAMKVEPQQIVAMLAWQLNVLAIIKSAGDKPTDDIAKEAKLNPYVVRKSASVARRLSLEEIKDLVSALNKLDLRSKRSALDLDEALQYFILKISQ
jgi:DNA polymerase III delta subunit